MFGRRGQSETTVTGEGSELWTPLKTAAIIALLADLSWACCHLAFFLGWIVFGGLWPVSTWRKWFLAWGWFTLAVPCIAAWPAAGYIVIRFRFLPELKNKNWPPTYSQLDPELGLVHEGNIDERLKKRAEHRNALDEAYRERFGDEEDEE